jgi:hypothetical protein
MDSVESVFAKYRDAMEAQHQRLSEDLSVQMSHLRPHSQLRLTDAGLEMTIRFPVPLERSAVIDDEVTRNLLEAIGASHASSWPPPELRSSRPPATALRLQTRTDRAQDRRASCKP